ARQGASERGGGPPSHFWAEVLTFPWLAPAAAGVYYPYNRFTYGGDAQWLGRHRLWSKSASASRSTAICRRDFKNVSTLTAAFFARPGGNAGAADMFCRG